jgi:3-hydroxyisobutyrate dehydrogenase
MPTMQQATVGVAGLGSMGGGMAGALLRAGLRVRGVDANPARAADLAKNGLIATATPAQAARDADALLISVVDAGQTQAVLFGAGGAVETLRAGAVVIATSTVPPPFVEALEGRLREHGILLIDAPVSGGTSKAATGELSIMASGDPAAFSAAAPVLDAIAAKVYRLGDRAGIGSRMKSVNQLLAGVHIAAGCEAIAYAIRLGVEPAEAYDVITHSAGNSCIFENRIPHVLENDYTPRSAVNIFVKDLGIVLDQGRVDKFPLPLTAAAHQLFLAAAGMGMGGDDDASIARVFAALSGIKLPQ